MTEIDYDELQKANPRELWNSNLIRELKTAPSAVRKYARSYGIYKGFYLLSSRIQRINEQYNPTAIIATIFNEGKTGCKDLSLWGEWLNNNLKPGETIQ